MTQLATEEHRRRRRMHVQPTSESRLMADVARFYGRRKSSSLWLPPEMRRDSERAPRVELSPLPAGPVGSQQPGSALFNPLTLSAKYGFPIDCWWRSDLGQLLSGNLFQIAGSTTGPIISTGGSTAGVYSPIVETNDVSGGTGVGQMKFRYGPVVGQWTETGVVSATTVNLIGPFAGMALGFPAGAYANDYRYQGINAGSQDQTGNGNDSINVDYTVSPFLESSGSYSGVPSIRTGPTALPVRWTRSQTLGALMSGADQPWYMAIDLELMSTALSNILWNFGNSATNAKSFHELQFSNTTGVWLYNREDDAVTPLLRQRFTAAATAGLGVRRQQIPFSGTNMTLTENGSALALPGGNADLNVGVITCSYFTFGGRFGVSASALTDARLNEFIWARGTAPAGFQAELTTYLNQGRARFRQWQ